MLGDLPRSCGFAGNEQCCTEIAPERFRYASDATYVCAIAFGAGERSQALSLELLQSGKEDRGRADLRAKLCTEFCRYTYSALLMCRCLSSSDLLMAL